MNFLTNVALPPNRSKELQPLAMVDQLLANIARSQDSEKNAEILQDVILLGSKRLAARISLEASRLWGLRPKDHIGWAASAELFNASHLIHRNLHEQQRGDLPILPNRTFSDHIVISQITNYLPVLSIQSLPISDGLRWKLWSLLTYYSNQMSEVDSMEIEFHGSRMQRGLKVLHDKILNIRAIPYFELPMHGTALIANLSEKEALRISPVFRDLGILYMLIEDVMDLYGESSSGHHGFRIKRGLMSRLIVEHLERFPQDREEIIKLLTQSAEQIEAFQELSSELKTKGALAAVVVEIQFIALKINSSDELKPWPKVLDLARNYVKSFLRPIDHLIGQ